MYEWEKNVCNINHSSHLTIFFPFVSVIIHGYSESLIIAVGVSTNKKNTRRTTVLVIIYESDEV